MRKKSEFTILERAMQTVVGFDKVYHKMKQQTILGGRSQSTLENYLPEILCNRDFMLGRSDHMKSYLLAVRLLLYSIFQI